jgi:predicted DNA-binding transcriptional regulator YafY
MKPATARAPKHGKTKRLGRPSGRFTQHRRLSKLEAALDQHPAGIALEDLASMLHVTTRSVRRYLLELGQITALESIPKEPGGAHLWRIKPTERGRSVHLRRAQAYALFAARNAFEPMRGSALFDELDLAHRQMLQLAQRPGRAGVKGEVPNDHRLEERFLVMAPAPRTHPKRGEEIDALFLAVAELHPLRFRYIEADDAPTRAVAAEVHPYAMIVDKGAISLLAADPTSDEIRCYAFERMLDVSPDESRRFELPVEFDAADYVNGAFGVARPGPRTRVLVEFDATVAPEIKQTRLHPSQKIATAPDGRVRLSVTLVDVSELKRWVLGFGEAARVIEPDELAGEIARTLRRAAARYG